MNFDQLRTRREWVCRFADQMVESSDYEMCLGEALKLGKAEYERWSAASPEATVKRLISGCERDVRRGLPGRRGIPARGALPAFGVFGKKRVDDGRACAKQE